MHHFDLFLEITSEQSDLILGSCNCCKFIEHNNYETAIHQRQMDRYSAAEVDRLVVSFLEILAVRVLLLFWEQTFSSVYGAQQHYELILYYCIIEDTETQTGT